MQAEYNWRFDEMQVAMNRRFDEMQAEMNRRLDDMKDERRKKRRLLSILTRFAKTWRKTCGKGIGVGGSRLLSGAMAWQC